MCIIYSVSIVCREYEMTVSVREILRIRAKDIRLGWICWNIEKEIETNFGKTKEGMFEVGKVDNAQMSTGKWNTKAFGRPHLCLHFALKSTEDNR